MVNKKKLDFNKIVKEFGFPTTISRLRSTYNIECKNPESELYAKAREFEARLTEEMERQERAESETVYSEHMTLGNYYERFQSIFLEYSEIFNPELYLLQLSVLLEKDYFAKEQIRSILKSKGIVEISEEFLDDLINKDTDAISNLLQILSRGGTRLQDGKKIIQMITEMSGSNVWIPEEKNGSIQSMIRTIRNRLSPSDVALVEVSDSNINVTSSQVHIGNERFLERKERDAKRKFDETLREIDLIAEIKKLAPCDLKNVFRYDNLGEVISQSLYLTREEVDSNDTKMVSRDPVTNLPYFNEDVLDMIISNLRYIDMDKLLLTILHVNLDAYEGEYSSFSYEDVQKLKKLSKAVENLLSQKNIEVKSGRVYDTMDYAKLNETIEWLDVSYIDGVFYSQEEISDMLIEYLTGTRDVTTLTAHEFRNVLSFSDGEIAIMLKQNPEVLKYIIENDILVEDNQDEKKFKQRIVELVEGQDTIPSEQLKILFEQGLLTQEYLLSLYLDMDKVSLATINELRESVGDEFFEGIVNADRLVELYLVKDEEGQKDKFDKYRKLYKELLLEGKTQEEKNEISDYILDQSLELLREERILELYSLGLITIDALIDYTGGYELKSLYVSNELKPADAKRLYYQGIITDDMLKEIILDKGIDEGKKLTLLYSTFPEPEDTEIMRKLESCLREVTESTNYSHSGAKKTSTTSERKKTPEDELKKLKRAYEPRSRYRLLSTIDPEYQFRYNVKDGMGIFYFPNRDEYIIEKLYAKGNMPANGVATYVLSKDLFEANQDRIMQDGVVNISELYALKKASQTGIRRFVHTGWANAIVKYYGLDDERRYSKKQIAQTKALAKQVEESKKSMEEFEI